MGRGLLSKLSAPSGSSGRITSVERSIVEHLQVLLNTRQGSSSALPDYGVPDFTDYLHNFPGGVHELQRAIQESIARHEPRLRNVIVKPVHLTDDGLNLLFEVSARLVDDRRRVLRFSTSVTRGGRVAVD